MARLVTSGFEIGIGTVTTDPDGQLNGTVASRDTATKRSGAASLRCNGVSSNTGTVIFGFPAVANDTGGVWVRIYLRINARSGSSGGCTILGIASGNNLTLNWQGKLVLGSDPSMTTILNVGQWYRIEVWWKNSATQANRAWEVRVDGVTVSSGTGQTTDSVAPSAVTMGISSLFYTLDMNIDDVAVNDASGADQNSWPGDGSVALLLPTADSAKGTGWTDDQASTASLFPSVDNTPPAGIADTTTGGGGHQIRNATNNANVNYDATMTTYTTVGVGTTDTVNLVLPWIATGAPLVTSAKLGTVGVVSNPAIANVNLGAGGTAGAFWSGVAAGTFPTGWKWTPGTLTYSPSVTKGTAPVMRVTQVTASTRIAMAAFMGMYVDYAPAATPLKPKRYGQSYTIAHRRAALR